MKQAQAGDASTCNFCNFLIAVCFAGTARRLFSQSKTTSSMHSAAASQLQMGAPLNLMQLCHNRLLLLCASGFLYETNAHASSSSPSCLQQLPPKYFGFNWF